MDSNVTSPLRIACFGTSLMEDRDVRAYPGINYPRRFEQLLAHARPDLAVTLDNHAVSGSTSREVRRAVRVVAASDARYDLVVVGCGVNDVWRRFQGRLDEAIGIDEYAANYVAILDALLSVTARAVLMLEPPTALPEADAMNAELQRYNAIAGRLAQERALDVVDCWDAFVDAAAAEATWPWTDGVHLSDTGDALMADALLRCVIADTIAGDTH